MKAGLLNVSLGECISDGNHVNSDSVSRILAQHGHFVKLCVCVSDSCDVASAFKSLLSSCEAVIVCGDTSAFYDAMSGEYAFDRNGSLFNLNGVICAVSDKCNDDFVTDTLVPALNGSRKTFYRTAVFRTVGKTETALRERLKDYIRNRNKISVKFAESADGCDVLVRYSNKMQKETVNDMLSAVNMALHDCIYAYDDKTDLATRVANLLIEKGKTIGLAESFTGGNIAASLVKTAGISASLQEGIVCYSSDCKKSRLRVDGAIIDNYGAVSDETAYEMAANLLMDGGYDYVVATTGNAGPTSEKPDEVGVCFIAVGDKTAIDVYHEKFEGDRASVIAQGTRTALHYLYKLLNYNPKSAE